MPDLSSSLSDLPVCELHDRARHLIALSAQIVQDDPDNPLAAVTHALAEIMAAYMAQGMDW